MSTVNLILPNGVEIVGIPACSLPIAGGDVLIGMDIIASGDFAITQDNGKTMLTFQIPSTHKIDFVDEINRKNSRPQLSDDERRRARNKRKAERRRGR